MYLDLLVILFLGISLWKTKLLTPSNSFNDDYMSIKNCNSYRGLFALIVILHHISQRVSGGVLLPDFTRVGYLAVSIFFFLSGYGLQKKNLSDSTYSRAFLLKRIPTILIPYLIMSIIYWLVYALLGDVRLLTVVIDNFIKYGDPIVWFSWYVVSIMSFYFGFFVLMKLFKKHRLGMVLGGVIYYIIYVFICQKLSFGLWWYSTSLFPVLGILWASYEDKILNFIKKRYAVLLPVALASFIVLAKFKWSIYWGMPSVWTELILIIVLAFLFIVICLISSLKLNFGNKILDFLGKISFEIYMAQGLFMLLFRNARFRIESDFLWSIAVIAGSFILAFLLNRLFAFILKKYKALIIHF